MLPRLVTSRAASGSHAGPIGTEGSAGAAQGEHDCTVESQSLPFGHFLDAERGEQPD